MDSANSDRCTAHSLRRAEQTVKAIRDIFATTKMSRTGAIRLLIANLDEIETLRRIFETLHFDEFTVLNGKLLCDVANALSLVYYRIGRFSSAENVLLHTWGWVAPNESSAPGLSQVAVNRCRLAAASSAHNIGDLVKTGVNFVTEWRDFLGMVPANEENKGKGLSIYEIQLVEIIRQALLASNSDKLSPEIMALVCSYAKSWNGPPIDIIWLAQANSMSTRDLVTMLKKPHFSFDDGKIYRSVLEKKIEAYAP